MEKFMEHNGWIIFTAIGIGNIICGALITYNLFSILALLNR